MLREVQWFYYAGAIWQLAFETEPSQESQYCVVSAPGHRVRWPVWQAVFRGVAPPPIDQAKTRIDETGCSTGTCQCHVLV